MSNLLRQLLSSLVILEDCCIQIFLHGISILSMHNNLILLLSIFHLLLLLLRLSIKVLLLLWVGSNICSCSHPKLCLLFRCHHPHSHSLTILVTWVETSWSSWDSELTAHVGFIYIVLVGVTFRRYHTTWILFACLTISTTCILWRGYWLFVRTAVWVGMLVTRVVVIFLILRPVDSIT